MSPCPLLADGQEVFSCPSFSLQAHVLWFLPRPIFCVFVGKTEAGAAVSTGFFQGRTMTTYKKPCAVLCIPAGGGFYLPEPAVTGAGPSLCLSGGSHRVRKQPDCGI